MEHVDSTDEEDNLSHTSYHHHRSHILGDANNNHTCTKSPSQCSSPLMIKSRSRSRSMEHDRSRSRSLSSCSEVEVDSPPPSPRTHIRSIHYEHSASRILIEASSSQRHIVSSPPSSTTALELSQIGKKSEQFSVSNLLRDDLPKSQKSPLNISFPSSPIEMLR